MTKGAAAAVCLMLVTARPRVGQNASTPPEQPVITISDVVAKIGSAADARAVLSTVLTHAMRNQSKKEFFLESQIRNERLPEVLGVELVRLADNEISGHLAMCGTYWLISKVERAGNVVSLFLGQKCSGSVLGYTVSVEGFGWHLGPPGTGRDGGGWQPGIGSGFVSGRPPECRCH
jgi:hypothetical protein